MPVPPPVRPPTASGRPPTAQNQQPMPVPVVMPEPVAPQPQYARSPGNSLPPVSEHESDSDDAGRDPRDQRPTAESSEDEDENDDRRYNDQRSRGFASSANEVPDEALERPYEQDRVSPPPVRHIIEGSAEHALRRSLPGHFSPWEVVPTPLPPPDPFLAHAQRQAQVQPPAPMPEAVRQARAVPPQPSHRYPYGVPIVNPNSNITVHHMRMSPPSQPISEIDLVSPPARPGPRRSESLRDVLGEAADMDARRRRADDGVRARLGPHTGIVADL